MYTILYSNFVLDNTVITEEQFVQITSPKQPEQLIQQLSEIDTPSESSGILIRVYLS